MPVLEPVTPFLSLIDRLISLVKARQTRRREYFEKIIDPLYSQFKPLGEDYLKLFRDAREIVVSSKKTSPKRATMQIRKRREDFWAARAQLRALLEACERNSKKKKDEELTEFIRAMSQFFSPTSSARVGSLGAVLVDFFQEAERIRSSRAPEVFIGSATARLEGLWYEIGGRYMELKLKYLAD